MTDESLKAAEPKRYRGTVYISISFTFAICILAAIFIPGALGYADLEISDLVVLLVFLLFISLVIERSIEAILNSWRRRGKQERRLDLKQIKKTIEREKDAQKKEKLQIKEEELSKNLDVYTSVNRTLALLMGLGIGIAVSALGVRILQPLVDPDAVANMTALHRKFFAGVDIFVTGGLIGGGSNGIHRILDTVLSWSDKISAKNKKEEQEQQE
jgi:hypothetical protein